MVRKICHGARSIVSNIQPRHIHYPVLPDHLRLQHMARQHSGPESDYRSYYCYVLPVDCPPGKLKLFDFKLAASLTMCGRP